MGRLTVVYVGNGATGSDYDALFREQGWKGETFSGLGGTYNQCAIWQVPKPLLHSGNIPVYERFRHPSEEAHFDGFILRKNKDQCWLWFLPDGSWAELSSEMPEPKRFREGDLLPIPEKATCTYVLESRWTDAQGQSMNCGYRMFRNRVMAHAFGKLNDKVYLNTRAALEHSRERGFHYFETDVTRTADGRLVLIHGWGKEDCERFGIPYDPAYEHMTYEMVRKLRICGEPVMDASEFFALIRDLPQTDCFEIDPHNILPKETQKVVSTLMEDVGEDKACLDRVLFQVYNQKMHRAADATHHFEVYQYNIHNNTRKLDIIITYCLNHGICSVAIRAGEAQRETVQKLKKAGLYVLAYTIDSDLTYAKTMLDYGVDTICTNVITEQELDAHEERMGPYPYRLVYNSGSKKAVSSYEQPARKLSNGCLEVEENGLWENTGEKAVSACRFSVPGKRFVGWHMRIKRNGGQHWYCKDGLFRLVTKFVPGTDRDPYLFPENAVLPVWDVHRDASVVLVAVYE